MTLLLLFAGSRPIPRPYTIKPRLIGEAKREEPRLKGGGK